MPTAYRDARSPGTVGMDDNEPPCGLESIPDPLEELLRVEPFLYLILCFLSKVFLIQKMFAKYEISIKTQNKQIQA